MKAYTEGEWVYDGFGDVILKGSGGGWGNFIKPTVICCLDPIIIGCLDDLGNTRNENKYDGYLIAAAPDLYEALEDLLENYKENKGEGLGIGPIMKAKQALAKARGESVDK